MARIVELSHDTTLDARRSRTSVACRWNASHAAGEPVIVLRTYGSEARQNEGTPSQALELGRPEAVELIQALRVVFPDIA